MFPHDLKVEAYISTTPGTAKKCWNATSDSRVCPIHSKIRGQTMLQRRSSNKEDQKAAGPAKKWTYLNQIPWWAWIHHGGKLRKPISLGITMFATSYLSVSGCVRAHDAGCTSAKLLTPLNMGGYGSMWTNSTKRWPFKTTPVTRERGHMPATCSGFTQMVERHIYTITSRAAQHFPRRPRAKTEMNAHNSSMFVLVVCKPCSCLVSEKFNANDQKYN